jgi:hypothetical protein
MLGMKVDNLNRMLVAIGKRDDLTPRFMIS